MTVKKRSHVEFNPGDRQTVTEGDENLLDALRRERALRQRLDRFEVIFDNLPEGVIVVDIEGRIVSVNPYARTLLGNPADSIAPDRWPQEMGFFLDDGQTYYPVSRMPNIRALHGETIVSEEMMLKPGGAERPQWVAVSAQPLAGADGIIDGAVVVFRDVTYRKQVEVSREKHAHRAEALYRFSRSLAEVGDDVLQVLNNAAIQTAENIGDSSVAYMVNPESNRIEIYSAYHRDADSRALLRALLISQSYQLEDSMMNGVVRTGEPLFIPLMTSQQLAVISIPGFDKFIEKVGVQSLMIVPLKGRSRVIGTLALSRDRGGQAYTAEDLTFIEDIARRTALAVENCKLFDSLRAQVVERRLAEKAALESEERLHSIFDGSALGIKVLDLEGVMLQANPALQAMLGLSADEIVGRHFTSFIHPDDVSSSMSHFELLIRGGLERTYLDYRLVDKNGVIVWVRGTFAGVKEIDQEGAYRFVVVMVENITHSKVAAAELLEMKARLLSSIESERLHLAQELHDGAMQNLHSVVYRFGSLREKLLPENRELLDGARDAINAVIQELRATAKDLRPPTLMDFGLEKAIRSHVVEFREQYPDLKIHLALTSDRRLLSEDIRLALFRIYQMALMNVVRHSEAKNVKIGFTFDAEEVSLEIEDDGKGFVVPPRWIFFTRNGHLGLAGAAERVETLNGKFSVFSEPGKGTRLLVTIPSRLGKEND